MISLFDLELKRMEQEVRDLKTIHQHGLGTTRFYVYDRTITIPGDYYEWRFIGTVEDPATIPMEQFHLWVAYQSIRQSVLQTPKLWSVVLQAKEQFMFGLFLQHH